MLSPIQRIVVQDGTHTTCALVPSFFRTTILQKEILSFPFIFLRKLRLGKLVIQVQPPNPQHIPRDISGSRG